VASLSDSAPSSGKSTGQGLLNAGFGRMSSPLNTIQWVANYRGSFNINTNSDTATYQFFTNTADLYLTRNPLARTQTGLKLEGNYNLQNTSLPGESSITSMGSYSFTGEVGPYVKSTLSRGVLLSLEGYYRPGHFFNDSGGAFDQSGNGAVLRSSLTFDRSSTWFNPAGTLGFEINQTNGINYRSRTLATGLSNLMRIGSNNLVTLSATLNFVKYPVSEEGRDTDTFFAARADWVHTLDPHWTVIGDVGYTKNSSHLDSYTYSQPVVTAGAGYSF
jgi:hypothetical protein